MRLRWVWPCAAWLLLPLAANSQERQGSALSLDEALARARAAGASVALAEGRVEEARARRARAGRWLRDQPVVEAVAGPRRRDGERSTDLEIGLAQDVEPAARRQARLAGAEAAVARAESELAEARRLLLGEVAAAFVRALAARERRDVLAESRRVAEELL